MRDLELDSDRFEFEQQALEECQLELLSLPPPHFNCYPEWPARSSREWLDDGWPF